MLTRKQIQKEEKSNVDAEKKRKKGGPLLRGNLGRYGTIMSKRKPNKPSRKRG